MAAGGVFPNEMPDDAPFPTAPLDDDTAERLLRGRLAPEDAPTPYTEVARVLRAAAAPPTPRELAGHPAALAAFRTAQKGGSGQGGLARRGPTLAGVGRGGSAWAGVGWGRARVVALALAGTLAVGGLWMVAGAQTAPGLRSPTGGPGAGGSGSATSTSGLLRPAMPPTGPAATGRAPVPPPDRDPASGRPGAAASQGAAHRTHPAPPGKPPKPKPSKPKPKKPKTPGASGSVAAAARTSSTS
jgi:hypothetical protein